METGTITLTTVEMNKAIRTTGNVNRMLKRVVGGVELAGAEDARETYSALGLSSSNCTGNWQDVARISRTRMMVGHESETIELELARSMRDDM